jgi:hypothetical protein
MKRIMIFAAALLLLAGVWSSGLTGRRAFAAPAQDSINDI